MSCLPYKNVGDLNESQSLGDKRGKYENKISFKIVGNIYVSVLEDTS